MRVAELIEKLKEFDPELEVMVQEEIIYEGASPAPSYVIKQADYRCDFRDYVTHPPKTAPAVFIFARGDEDYYL